MVQSRKYQFHQPCITHLLFTEIVITQRHLTAFWRVTVGIVVTVFHLFDAFATSTA